MSETLRLEQDEQRQVNWKRWGPYLPDRQWSTVREDYSPTGDAWNDFPHDAARSRTYRWGEDGLLGWCDRQCRLCFSIALWNYQDPFLKERLFGLTGPEGNHGEDVKECYYFLDSTPTHSYCRALYKYPQQAFPYQQLRDENRRRNRLQPEYELHHTDVFDNGAYFDCYLEYAKAGPDDILIRISVVNRHSHDRKLALLPTCWFRNTWGWGRQGEGYSQRPHIETHPQGGLLLRHPELGDYHFECDTNGEWLFTENESNLERLYGVPNRTPYVKDAFHRYLVNGEQTAVNPERQGSKAACLLQLTVPAQDSLEIRCRLRPSAESGEPWVDFEAQMARRLKEAEDFYAARQPPFLSQEEALVWRQALAGLLWSKKFYHFDVRAWLEGDPTSPPPPPQRWKGRNRNWACHLYNRDVLLLPDGWEYPWYAAWDTAFHVIPMVAVDPTLAKEQLILLVREWYQHPNGQIPAYEWNFDDVNPPVHAWAAWRVYRADGSRDQKFLARMFHKLLLNFTWWINRTDKDGNNVFGGGFLGLDNIGALDRSHLPPGVSLEQADATAWIAFYCLQMLRIALELAQHQPEYEDIASKFFEHFVAITHAMNSLGEMGLWDEEDGFYYDVMHHGPRFSRLKVRSMVGLLPLIAVGNLDAEKLECVPGFRKRLEWFVAHRPHLSRHLERRHSQILLAVTGRERLRRVLSRLLDPEEFLSDYGVRSLSRAHAKQPFEMMFQGQRLRVGYEPAESESPMFGGNSNWRGPIWLPVNYLLIVALEQYHRFYGTSFKVDFEGRSLSLHEVANRLRERLVRLFLPGPDGQRPSHRDCPQHTQPGWSHALWFHEYFHGDDGRGLGACHQTGWTALVAPLLHRLAQDRS